MALLQLLARLGALAATLGRTLCDVFRFALDLLRAVLGRGHARKYRRNLRPWMTVREGSEAVAGRLIVSDADTRRLLDRMRRLNDVAKLTTKAVGFAGAGADFFADPREVEDLVEALVRENPPFLHVAREQPSHGEGDANEFQTEYLVREEEVVVTEPQTLFIPQTGVEHLESSRPPGYPVLRSARSLSDLRSVGLVYQDLPEDLLVARLLEGSLPVLAYREERRYLLFRPEERWIRHRERRENRVPIEIETGGATTNSGERLMYMLFDRSTSLVHNCSPRGINAVMELALAVAMLRADMGRPHARYYFRAFADRLDPLAKDPPLQASTVAEKDWLVDRIFRTNFSGEATHVVEALTAAMDDIEHILETGELGPSVRPRIGLLTDGRSSLYGGVGTRLKRLGIAMDTILIGRDAAHNPDLLRISSTVSYVDPMLYRSPALAA